MMRFAPNIEFLFTELDSYEARVEAAAACGAAAVELWGFANKSLPALRRALDACGVAAAAMVIDPLVGALAQRAEFLAAVDRTLDAARDLGCATVIVISGPPSGADASRVLSEALAEAAGLATAARVGLALEALNTTDHPHAFLKNVSTAIDIVEAVGSPALGVVVDLYHTAVMGERVAEAVAGHELWVRHVQLSSGADRHEPLVDAPAVGALVRGGYRGYFGLEYRPTLGSAESVRRSIEHWKGAQP